MGSIDKVEIFRQLVVLLVLEIIIKTVRNFFHTTNNPAKRTIRYYDHQRLPPTPLLTSVIWLLFFVTTKTLLVSFNLGIFLSSFFFLLFTLSFSWYPSFYISTFYVERMNNKGSKHTVLVFSKRYSYRNFFHFHTRASLLSGLLYIRTFLESLGVLNPILILVQDQYHFFFLFCNFWFKKFYNLSKMDVPE